jgi:hypothetical protein
MEVRADRRGWLGPVCGRGRSLPRRFRCSGRGRPCAPNRLALGFVGGLPQINKVAGEVGPRRGIGMVRSNQ